MPILRINLDDPQADKRTYASCVTAGDFIFTSHIAGFFSDDGYLIEGTAAQTRQCIRRLGRILSEAGASLDQVVKVTVYLKDIDDFNDMRDAFRELFGRGYPARMTVTSQFVDPRCRIQMEAVAYVGE